MEIKPEEYKDYLQEEYLTIHEAAEILEVGEEELWELVRKHQIPTHTIAGAFLRFKKEDIDALEIKWRIDRELFPADKNLHSGPPALLKRESFSDKLRDFWYFNDFYVVCSALITILLYFIIVSQ